MVMRFFSILLAGLLAAPVPSPLSAQAPVLKLNLVIVEGEGAVNNIKLRTAREAIVQVEDENHKPVAGAAVVFTLPSQGAGGAFASGQTFTTVTDAQGRAVARGLRPNRIQGRFQIHVTASKDGQTTNADIAMSNALPAGAVAGAASVKLIVILAVAAAGGLAGGLVYATHNGGGNNNGGVITTTTISTGTGTVGPPR